MIGRYYPKDMVLYRGWLMGTNERKEGVEFQDSPILIDGSATPEVQYMKRFHRLEVQHA